MCQLRSQNPPSSSLYFSAFKQKTINKYFGISTLKCRGKKAAVLYLSNYCSVFIHFKQHQGSI